MTNTIPLADILDRIRDHVISAINGAILSPQMFDARMNPGGPNYTKMISFGMARTDNTDQYRGRDEERLAHVVQIGICERMRMSAQYDTMRALLVRVERITSAMSSKAAFIRMRISYRGATYPITPAREYQLGLMNFSVRADMHVAF